MSVSVTFRKSIPLPNATCKASLMFGRNKLTGTIYRFLETENSRFRLTREDCRRAYDAFK